jgi:hypothetical protein
MPRVLSATSRYRTSSRALLFGLCCLASLAATLGPARAEELGTRQNLVFSAERLFGFYVDNETRESGGRDISIDRTYVGLGWSGPVTPLVIPRLGIDYFVGSGFTLGGSLGFASGSVESNTITSVLVGLRAGYALRLGHAVSLWPRAGFTYTSTNLENNNDDTYTFALTIDAPFTFALTEGFAFALGPMLDLGFLAERANADASEVVFGLAIGLLGWTNL